MPRRVRLVPAVLLACCAVLLSACSSGDESPESAGTLLADRWLRLGEEPQAEVLVFDRALPPGFSELLNPSATADTPEADRLALPVHPQGELLGSYLIRRTDGSNLVWLLYDLPGGTVAEAADTLATQLDQTPWQVTGGQAGAAFTLVSFQSTRSGDLEGTAVVQPVPALSTFELIVDRDGSATTLTVPRGSIIPLLDAEIGADLAVQSTRAGLASAAGLREGDRITSAGGTVVATRDDLEAALAGLAAGSFASITYLLQIAPASVVDALPFTPPAGIVLPASFPSRSAFDGLTPLGYSWTKEPAGSFWQANLVSTDPTTAVVDRVRSGLEAAGWEIVADAPVGFATRIDFRNVAESLAGSVQMDLSPDDEDYTQVVIVIQTDTTAGN
ncbi:MAG: PDZ domain-containing protein [Dehalococcoidia bacterium]|nr:PDZ domain-containing protein [Dehalococcoidia bacterium]